MSCAMLFAVVELTGSHLESTFATWLILAVSLGRSRKAPKPAVPELSRTLIPRRNFGWKAAVTIRLRLSISAWKGRAVMLALSLFNVIIRFKRKTLVDILTSLGK